MAKRNKSGFVADHSNDPLTGQPWAPGEKPKRAKNTKGLTVVSQGPVDIVEESLTGSDAPDWTKTKGERMLERIQKTTAEREADLAPVVEAENTVKPNRKAKKDRKQAKAAKKVAAKKVSKAGIKLRKDGKPRKNGAVPRIKTLAPRKPRGAYKSVEAKAETQRKASVRKQAAKEALPPKPEGRQAKIIALISTKRGASLNEIMAATGWQAHSVRGFMSTQCKKGQPIESFKSEDGRTYRLMPEGKPSK